MSQSSAIPALQSTQEGKEHLFDMAGIRLQPLATESPEELRRWKHRQEASESWDAYERNDSSEPRLLHLPIYRKALNSLTWAIWFSLIHKNTFDVQTTCPVLQTSTSPESSSLPSWKNSLKATWDATSGIYVWKISANKTQLSTFRLWLFFKSTMVN